MLLFRYSMAGKGIYKNTQGKLTLRQCYEEQWLQRINLHIRFIFKFNNIFINSRKKSIFIKLFGVKVNSDYVNHKTNVADWCVT